MGRSPPWPNFDMSVSTWPVLDFGPGFRALLTLVVGRLRRARGLLLNSVDPRPEGPADLASELVSKNVRLAFARSCWRTWIGLASAGPSPTRWGVARPQLIARLRRGTTSYARSNRVGLSPGSAISSDEYMKRGVEWLPANVGVKPQRRP